MGAEDCAGVKRGRAVFEELGVEDVCAFLKGVIGPGISAPVLQLVRANEVDGEVLASMSEDELQTELGVLKWGHRRRITCRLRTMAQRGAWVFSKLAEEHLEEATPTANPGTSRNSNKNERESLGGARCDTEAVLHASPTNVAAAPPQSATSAVLTAAAPPPAVAATAPPPKAEQDVTAVTQASGKKASGNGIEEGAAAVDSPRASVGGDIAQEDHSVEPPEPCEGGDELELGEGRQAGQRRDSWLSRVIGVAGKLLGSTSEQQSSPNAKDSNLRPEPDTAQTVSPVRQAVCRGVDGKQAGALPGVASAESKELEKEASPVPASPPGTIDAVEDEEVTVSDAPASLPAGNAPMRVSLGRDTKERQNARTGDVQDRETLKNTLQAPVCGGGSNPEATETELATCSHVPRGWLVGAGMVASPGVAKDIGMMAENGSPALGLSTAQAACSAAAGTPSCPGQPSDGQGRGRECDDSAERSVPKDIKAMKGNTKTPMGGSIQNPTTLSYGTGPVTARGNSSLTRAASSAGVAQGKEHGGQQGSVCGAQATSDATPCPETPAVPSAPSAPAGSMLTLHVSVKHDDGRVMLSAVSPATVLRQLLEAFCTKTGLCAKELCLKRDGKELGLWHTVAHYGIRELDTLQCSVSSDVVTLLLKDGWSNGKKLIRAKVKRKQALKKLFDTYAKQAKKPLWRFVFTLDGGKLSEGATPASIGMADNDVITVALR